MKKLLFFSLVLFFVLNVFANESKGFVSKFYNIKTEGNQITSNLYTSVEFFQAKESKTNVNFGIGTYMQFEKIHVFGDVYLKENINTTNLNTNNEEIVNSSKARIAAFFPFSDTILINNNDDFKVKLINKEFNAMYGLIIEGSTIKVSNEYKSKRDTYLGFRFALTPNKYFDFMYGKSNGLKHRLKIRTEYQLTTSIIFGASYSFEPTSSVINEENQDIFKSYIRVPISIDYIKGFFKNQ